MGSLSTGGGSGAVAASAHAGCERFRHTDPMIIGRSRRALAARLGHPDTSAGIPEARWVRAMTFERLVRHERFVSQLLTTTIGRLGLARPTGVRRADGGVNVERTADAVQKAHVAALADGVATMITGLAIPFVGMQTYPSATPVKPDFAIVAPKVSVDDPDGTTATGTWLVMGDAKDYERVRSRIDDQRMLKGFLQVALGAVSAEAWSRLPTGMSVHQWGALAVPRNAFLQPIAVVEDLRDHRVEVSDRAEERRLAMERLGGHVVPDEQLAQFVTHLEMTFDPQSCRSCSLHNLCRTEVRAHPEPSWRLIEIGVPVAQRRALLGVVDGSSDGSPAPPSSIARVRATITGRAQWLDVKRSDPIGRPGCVNLVLAKSDAAALGVHGIALHVVTAAGRGEWSTHVFADPQAAATRLAVMELVGGAVEAAMADRAVAAGAQVPEPIHIVVPDTATADVLVSIADSLAGVEISRLRWDRDRQVGRPVLNWDGEPASVPAPLTDRQRLAVSFLLDDDRNRALTLRTALLDARGVLANHLVPGGAAFEALRLDYLLAWAEAVAPLDPRTVADTIAALVPTPGARLSNVRSDAIHRESRSGNRRDAARYAALVTDELGYKADVLDRVTAVLDGLDDSRVRSARSALESDAQQVWRRRLALHASDLVRFGRVDWWWRNDQVDQIDVDGRCATQLLALRSFPAAHELATNAGTREVALATVVSSAPLRLTVHSRRLGAGSVVHLAHSEQGPSVERDDTSIKVQATSFKFITQPVGPLVADDQTERDGSLRFEIGDGLGLAEGSEVILLDGSWVMAFKSKKDVAVARPKLDHNSAPKPACGPGDHDLDPDTHKHCCRSHESREAETSDWIADQRAAGRMNPEVWPPVVDDDAFDTPALDTPTEKTEAATTTTVPEDITMDDLE